MIFRILFATAILLVAPWRTCHAIPPVALSGTIELRVEAGHLWSKWRALQKKIDKERATYIACRNDSARCPNKATRRWLSLSRRQTGRIALASIEEINRFINLHPYRSDLRQFGKSDYWASPLEFLGRGGDCDDYAIAKYVALANLGVSSDTLRMAVVKDEATDSVHAVVTLFRDRQYLLLDNLDDKLVPDTSRPNYVPMFSFSADGMWQHLPQGLLLSREYPHDDGPLLQQFASIEPCLVPPACYVKDW
ncbi:MAG: transglutaminase-like cysteine peptidase [Geminicoccaceae bacterium]|nr:transglutaminase-like cysteine peptidase [Geminicoccaceae bacterium]MCB9943064.1 transglutaminase-like cysteine peptidase [Geminicoccaceae bacterium]